MSEVLMSGFANRIMKQKYSHVMKNGKQEEWENISYRVPKHVFGAVGSPVKLRDRFQQLMTERKIIPGGRYLYATGRMFHQTQNCLLLNTEDSREGWADHMQKCAMGLMTGAGIGAWYGDIRSEGKPIRKTGGFASGPIALMQMTNESGRWIQQGGSRRSAIWAGLPWSHADIMKFIGLKNWIPEVRAMKEKDFNFPATMDGTNISVGLDDDFFEAYDDEKHELHKFAHSVYWTTIRQMLKTGEPGFSINCGKNRREVLRNAPVCGETKVLTDEGYQEVFDLIGRYKTVWTGRQWAKDVIFTQTSPEAKIVKVDMSNGRYIRCDVSHPFFLEIQGSLEKVRADELRRGDILHVSNPFQDIEHIVVSDIKEDGSAPVYCADVQVPEHSFQAEGVIISNCTEVSSETDSDICNLGSINLANVESLEEMEELVDLGIAFLLAGTVYSDVPYAKVDQVRQKNRRLGLGLMGIHEWLLKHGGRYEANEELGKYLAIYARSGKAAKYYADKWDLSTPVKTRAIAPTGTIGIIAETTTGIEPIFCAAFKRRYLKGDTWNYEYVIDPTAKRLVDSGVNPSGIEDAYSLAEDVERRVAFQAWVQEFVDHSISSTINLPQWGSELNNEGTVRKFGNMLIKYLPKLRGLTVYPDGSRGGQPLTAVSYHTAMKHLDQVTIESQDICDITKGESCGS